MHKKPCTVNYRRLIRGETSFPADPLCRLIYKALERPGSDGKVIGRSAIQRVARAPGNDEHRRLANHIHSTAEFVFGNLCLVTKGEMQALIRMIDEAETAEEHGDLAETLAAFDIAEAPPLEGMDYVQAMAYWLAIGDHFYVIQHPSLPARAFEEYLTWLLGDRAGVLAPEHQIVFKVRFNAGAVGNLGAIQEVEIGARGRPPVSSTERSTETRIVTVERERTVRDEKFDTWPALTRMVEGIFDPVEAKRILANIPQDAELEVKLRIGYRTRNKEARKVGMEAIAALASNLSDSDIRLHTANGVIDGDDAVLRKTIQVRRVRPGGALLVLGDAMTQMLEVHRQFLADGRLG